MAREHIVVEATSAPPVKIVARLGFLKAERHAVPRIHGVDAEKRCVHRLAMAPKSMQSTSQKHVAGADEQQEAAFQVAFSRALATDDPRWSSLGSPRKLTDAVGRSPVGEGAESMNSPRRSATTPRGCRADAVGKLPGGVGVGRRISPRTSVATPRGCRIDDLDNFVITPRPRPPPCANPPWGLVDFCEVFFVKRNRRGGLHGDRCRGREDMTELQRRAFRWVVVTSRLVCADSCPHPRDAVSLVHRQNQPPSAQPSQRQAESKPMPVASCKSSAQHQSQPQSTSASARRADSKPVPVVPCRILVHNQSQPPPVQASARRARATLAPATQCKSSVLGRRDDNASHARSVQAAQRTHSLQNGDFSDAALEAAPLQLSQVLMGIRMGSKTPATASNDDMWQHHGVQGTESSNVAARTAPESPVQLSRVEGKLQSAEITGKSPRKAPVKLSKILMGMREGLSKISSDGNRFSSKDNTPTGIPGWNGTAHNGTGTSSNDTQFTNVQAEAGLLKRLTSNGTYSDGNDALSLNSEGGIGADALMRRTNVKSKYAAKLDNVHDETPKSSGKQYRKIARDSPAQILLNLPANNSDRDADSESTASAETPLGTPTGSPSGDVNHLSMHILGIRARYASGQTYISEKNRSGKSAMPVAGDKDKEGGNSGGGRRQRHWQPKFVNFGGAQLEDFAREIHSGMGAVEEKGLGQKAIVDMGRVELFMDSGRVDNIKSENGHDIENIPPGWRGELTDVTVSDQDLIEIANGRRMEPMRVGHMF